MDEFELLQAINTSAAELSSEMNSLLEDIENTGDCVLSNTQKLININEIFNGEIHSNLEKHILYDADFPAFMKK